MLCQLFVLLHFNYGSWNYGPCLSSDGIKLRVVKKTAL